MKKKDLTTKLLTLLILLNILTILSYVIGNINTEIDVNRVVSSTISILLLTVAAMIHNSNKE